jgi:hypothetical protein
MSYTLGLLFEYYRYRHDAIVRVYADDRLLDELSLSSDINMKCTEDAGDMLNNRFIGPKNKTHVMFIPEKLFLFEVDERHLCNRVRIEVQNDHNNYNNGFMTKFSYVKFHEILLVPSCLWEHDNWIRLRERCRKSNQPTMTHMPNVFPRHPSTDDIILQPDMRQYPREFFFGHLMGGSFSMEIPLSRKHGITHLGRPGPGRIYFNRILSRVLWAFNQLNMSI